MIKKHHYQPYDSSRDQSSLISRSSNTQSDISKQQSFVISAYEMEQARMDQLNIVKMSHGTNPLSRTGSHSESISMIKSSKDKPST